MAGSRMGMLLYPGSGKGRDRCARKKELRCAALCTFGVRQPVIEAKFVLDLANIGEILKSATAIEDHNEVEVVCADTRGVRTMFLDFCLSLQ